MLQVAPFFVCGTIISTFEKKCATAPAQKSAERNVVAQYQHSTFFSALQIYAAEKSAVLKNSTFISTG